MAIARPAANERPHLVVRRDFGAVRDLIRRMKASERLAGFGLFGRRTAGPTTDKRVARRCDHRRVSLTVHLTPVAFDGTYAEPLDDGAKTIIAITKAVSRQGVVLRHDKPFEASHAILAADSINGCPISLLMEVRWPNAEQSQTCITGGKFVGIVEAAE